MQLNQIRPNNQFQCEKKSCIFVFCKGLLGIAEYRIKITRAGEKTFKKNPGIKLHSGIKFAPRLALASRSPDTEHES